MQLALNERGGLPQCHVEQRLHREAGLNSALHVLSAPLAGGRGSTRQVQIKPDRQRSPPLERFFILGPRQALLAQGAWSAHTPKPSNWIPDMNPGRPFVQHRLLDIINESRAY